MTVVEGTLVALVRGGFDGKERRVDASQDVVSVADEEPAVAFFDGDGLPGEAFAGDDEVALE